MTPAQMRDIRRTALHSVLVGWALSLFLITLSAPGAHYREDIVSDQVVFDMFAMFATGVAGPTVRSAGFMVGYLLTTLFILGMFLWLPLPAPHP